MFVPRLFIVPCVWIRDGEEEGTAEEGSEEASIRSTGRLRGEYSPLLRGDNRAIS